MKIRFNGIVGEGGGGCIPCGARRPSHRSMQTSKFYTLPSGVQKTFYAGRIEEVSDSDGAFLLENMYVDKHGNKQPVFTRVE